MKRPNEAITVLKKNKALFAKHHVKALYVFGSVIREEDSPESDVDILVEFDEKAKIGLFEMVRLQKQLSDILNQPVDLATPDTLHSAFKDKILREAVRAA